MDLTLNGMQPFLSERGNRLVCNGEIYNSHKLIEDERLITQSESDCEVLLPLYEKYGIERLCQMIDGEFAFVIWDETQKDWVAARDPIGIRPMFYGYSRETGKLCFASEVKGLGDYCDYIKPFPPGSYLIGGKIRSYFELDKTRIETSECHVQGIQDRLTSAVSKRLQADAPVGFLLSGGLDSSLVCAIAQQQRSQPIKTFAIGMEKDPIDLKYAKQVADYIGSDHTEFIMTEQDVVNVLKNVIYSIESWDVTTVRASVGMWILCHRIKQSTDVKVLLTGEVSDELFGYKYTDFAPCPTSFQKESVKRVSEIYMYDALRADRCISAHGLEARVPFSDKAFVEHVMSIEPRLKMNTNGVGKFLLRQAFSGLDLLPETILWREKAAFSDAVGHSLVDILKDFAKNTYTSDDLAKAQVKYPHGTPMSLESLLYREIFEELFPGRSRLIKAMWMPNQEWEGCQVDDPSARVLANYGNSGV